MGEPNFKNSKLKRLVLLFSSAGFALILTIVLFVYQEISSKKEFVRVVDNLAQIENSLSTRVVGNLTQIENSLSTRYLGIFPQYIKNINSLLEDFIYEQKTTSKCDSVIIFEDVLYYGIRSDAAGFKKMIKNLLTISENGSHITIAYYDLNGMPFKQMVRDELISNKYQEGYSRDFLQYRNQVEKVRNECNAVEKTVSNDSLVIIYRNIVEKHFSEFFSEYAVSEEFKKLLISNVSDYKIFEPLICQRYFDSTKIDNRVKFEKSVKLMLKKLPYDNKKSASAIDERVNNLMLELDKIKNKNLNKDISLITYADYENTYRDLSLAIIEELSENGNIELLPLNENLMMSCWMVNSHERGLAIFAFPSKYSTEEIGFISHDMAFVRYINTMLQGIKSRMGKI